MPQECAFCRILADDVEKQILFKLRHFFVVFTKTNREGHMLIIPFRHVENIFELSKEEWEEMPVALEGCKFFGEEYGAQGYNVLANCGEVAAQTIMHAHIHVIPRFPEDRPVLVYEMKLRGIQIN